MALKVYPPYLLAKKNRICSLFGRVYGRLLVWRVVGPLLSRLGLPGPVERWLTQGATRHRQVIVEHGELREEVDVEVAPLILALWRRGIQTVTSCQNQGGMVMVEFVDVDTAVRFLELVAERDSEVESIYNRLVVNDEPRDWQRFRRKRVWRLSVGVIRDLNADYPDPDHFDVLFTFSLFVSFPRSDLPAVLAAVEAK